MNVDLQNIVAVQIQAALGGLPEEDQRNLVGNLVRGMLESARENADLAPTLSAVMDLQGILVVIVDERGVHTESTSRDDAEPRVQRLLADCQEAVDATLRTAGLSVGS